MAGPGARGPWLTGRVATSILLLRHARSTWNEEGRWQGWADPPLSEEGARAALHAAAHDALRAVEAAAASDLQRAVGTAELLGEDRSWPPVRRYRGLRERGAGEWTGRTRADIEATWPNALLTPVVEIPGGEAPAAVTARGVATLHRIAAEWPDACVVAVTHGALIRLVEGHLGAPSATVANLGGRWVTADAGRLVLGDKVEPLVAPTPRAGGH